MAMTVGCHGPTIGPVQLSLQDLAAALGVSPFCAEAHFASPCYARLAVVITDAGGKHRSEISMSSPDKDFRLSVLLFSDPKSGQPQRIGYAISAQNGEGEERFIGIDPDAGIQRLTTNADKAFLYDIELKMHSGTKDIHIELGTSATPFPELPSSP